MAKIGLPKGSGKTVESQGKVSEKSGNFEMDIEWQPCNMNILHFSNNIIIVQVFFNVFLLQK